MHTEKIAREHDIIQGTGKPIRLWTQGVPVDDKAKTQLHKAAQMPFIYKWLAVMPDVHVGIGATIGSVIPTKAAIIPAAVGVDIGCGMMAVQTSLNARDLPDNLHGLRTALEKAIPHGMSKRRGTDRDNGAWGVAPDRVDRAWAGLADDFAQICAKYPEAEKHQ